LGEKSMNLVELEEVWDMEGYYISQALMQYILILSPKKIILGGRVMNQQQIFSNVYKYLHNFLNDYVSLLKLTDYIVSPELGDRSRITGALLLAKAALKAG
jgi:fructokinase